MLASLSFIIWVAFITVPESFDILTTLKSLFIQLNLIWYVARSMNHLMIIKRTENGPLVSLADHYTMRSTFLRPLCMQQR